MPDHKGEFRTGNGRFCYPLTVTDHASGAILMIEAHENTREINALEAFRRLFEERGMPRAMRSDNGLPFASPNGLFNLSRLSVWRLRLGIAIERIQPGHPRQNGRHERMHLTLKKETARPPCANALQQQETFDGFVEVYNHQRPHQEIGGAYPGELYTPAPRICQPPDEPDYSFHDRTVRVARCGRICIGKRKISLSPVLAGQIFGLREVEDGIWLVFLPDYDHGFFDQKEDRVEPATNPFTPKAI